MRTAPRRSGRLKDVLVGAVGMLVVLLVALTITWWVVTEPVGGEARAPSSPTAEPPTSEPPTSEPQAPGPSADLSQDESWFEELNLEAPSLVTDGSLLRDVRAVGQDVVTSSDEVVAARVSVEATVPFEVVADEIGDGTTVEAASGDEATVVRTVELLGRELRVTATGTVEVDAGRLVVEPNSIDIGGPDLLSDATAAVVRRLVTIAYDIEGLPDGLALQEVDVLDDGFRAYLSGEDVQLVP